MRIAILDRDRCKSKDCAPNIKSVPCVRGCPLVRSGAEAIVIDEDSIYPRVIETVCTGCAICVKKCPFKALSITNIAEELKTDFVHRYGIGMFTLFRMPVIKPGKVIGLIGPNGVGKSTALRILAGEIKPNLGKPEEPPDWEEIIRHFRGNELQNYFKSLSEQNLKLVHKPQYVTKLPEVAKGQVSELLEKVDERGVVKNLIKSLSMDKFFDRDLSVLSGGELQRVAIAAVVAREADIYFFDEPSSFLDIKERLEIAKVLHELADLNKTVLIVEHDLAITDYLSDYVHILYGESGVYGIVSHLHGVREGINIYLEGFIADENIRFRDEPIRFLLNPIASEGWEGTETMLEFGRMEADLGNFHLKTEPGKIHRGEVIGIVGENGLGKSTFVKLLSGELKPSVGDPIDSELKVAVKPQYLNIDFDGTVRDFLQSVAGKNYNTSLYKTEVIKPFGIETIEDRYIKEISGGELQKVYIARTLSTPADLYLFDEPSAYIDSLARLSITKAIKRNIQNKKATGFIVEHDILCVDFLSDSLMVFTGQPGREGLAYPPIGLQQGMNLFLKGVEITFRRDPRTGRPRINKFGSELDRKQKKTGDYYYISPKKEE
ncbi:MAG: ribosome biogenesis/translation initiation ATPase RLI [Candidatus Lokiarchaeota archaeon]|nr:ribosome biogenesis/translation initiation ATPase RLI [Candidatus Lokiarchaeota archaeon]